MGKLVSSITKPISKGLSSIFGDEIGGALTTAALVAAMVYGGGALMGSFGVGAGGITGAKGAGIAAKAALGSKAGLGAVTAAGTAGYQQGAAKVQAEKQEAAQMEAQRRADEAIRQQELTRKRAMLAEQTGLAARSNAARNVKNTLQGLASSKLGSEEDKLGGA
jgi:hypothetical protein